MQRIETGIPGLVVLEPRVFEDGRGFFMESYHQRRFAELGIHGAFVQDNHSRSVRGTLRGLHYQWPQPQAKLCRVIRGEVLDVAVDIRRGSPTFGRWEAVLLSEGNRRQIYVPRGFAHGFVVLSDEAEFLYKCDDFYAPEHEHGIAWDDPDLSIAWGCDVPLLSRKDAANPRLRDVPEDWLPPYAVGDRE